MAYRLYKPTLEKLMGEATAAEKALVAMRDASGDLTLTTLHDIAGKLYAANLTASQALDEMTESRASSQAESDAVDQTIAELGGPSDFMAFASAMQAIQGAGTAYGMAVDQMLRDVQDQASTTGHYMVRLEVVATAPVNRSEIRMTSFIPAAVADPFRGTAAVSGVIASFVAARS